MLPPAMPPKKKPKKPKKKLKPIQASEESDESESADSGQQQIRGSRRFPTQQEIPEQNPKKADGKQQQQEKEVSDSESESGERDVCYRKDDYHVALKAEWSDQRATKTSFYCLCFVSGLNL